MKMLEMVNTLNKPEKLWFQCNYVKTGDELNFQQRQSTDFDAIKIAEYGELVASATKQLQIKVTSTINKSINREKSVLKFRSFPRKSAVQKLS